MLPDTPRQRTLRALRRGLLAGAILHTAAVAWIAWRWTPALRGTVLTLIDLPLSLFFGGAAGGRAVLWSVLLGGAQWAVIAGLLGIGVERLTRR